MKSVIGVGLLCAGLALPLAAASAQSTPGTTRGTEYGTASGTIVIPAGISFQVRLDHKITLGQASSGEGWTGLLAKDVYLSSGRLLVRAGAPVRGSVHLMHSSSDATQPPRAALRVTQINGWGVETNIHYQMISDRQSLNPAPNGKDLSHSADAAPAQQASANPAAAPRPTSEETLSFVTQ